MMGMEFFNKKDEIVPNAPLALPENGDDRRATELLLEKYRAAEDTIENTYRIAILEALVAHQQVEPLQLANELTVSLGDEFDAVTFHAVFADLDMDLATLWHHDGDGDDGDGMAWRHAA